MRLYFENIGGVYVIDPEIDEIIVVDNIFNKRCNVNCILKNENGSKFSINLSGFEYLENWNDDQILQWVNNELLKYQVK